MRLPVARPQNLLTLASVEDDGLGEELQVVWEVEPGARIIEKVSLPEGSGLDEPGTLDAFLDAVRWGAASTADHKNIQAPFRSGIELEDYQLDPVVRAIQMPRVNLLIADDMGLGKTIEAGMEDPEYRALGDREYRQLKLFSDAESEQWERNYDALRARLRAIPEEIGRETVAVRARFADPQPRMFPVAVTLLVPERMSRGLSSIGQQT